MLREQIKGAAYKLKRYPRVSYCMYVLNLTDKTKSKLKLLATVI